MRTIVALALLASIISAHEHDLHSSSLQHPIAEPHLRINGVPFSTRAYWIRRANQVLAELSSPCPFAAFATVIVNHTNTDGLGELVCLGINSSGETGNPTMHGEMAAINNCTSILTDPSGKYRMTPSEALNAFSSLSLYTNAESCPMCAAAIRWAGFREYIYGTRIHTLINKGWVQIRLSSRHIFRHTWELPHRVRMIGEILTNETDPYFSWQYDDSHPCPPGCARLGNTCEKV
ncbi:guanine deaminase [Thermoascus aurantiacus ATCC 26904]